MEKTVVGLKISKCKGKSTKKLCRYSKDVTPDKVVRERSGVDLLACTTKEARTNLFFRMGDTHHVFETGQLYFKEWRNVSEDTVLIQRVSLGQKPVGEIILPRQLKEARALVSDISKYHPNISFAHGCNEWGVGVIQITCSPYTTLFELYQKRNQMEKDSVIDLISVYIHELKSRCIKDYLIPGGFDMSSKFPKSRVNVLESALLYGYPLDFAAMHDTLHFRPNRMSKYMEFLNSLLSTQKQV